MPKRMEPPLKIFPSLIKGRIISQITSSKKGLFFFFSWRTNDKMMPNFSMGYITAVRLTSGRRDKLCKYDHLPLLMSSVELDVFKRAASFRARGRNILLVTLFRSISFLLCIYSATETVLFFIFYPSFSLPPKPYLCSKRILSANEDVALSSLFFFPAEKSSKEVIY